MSSGGRSRAAAMALLLGLTVVAGAAVLLPAALSWSKSGTEIREARSKMLRAERHQEANAALVETRTAWSQFASTEISGLVLEQSDQDAAAATKDRIAAAFAEFDGNARSIKAEAVEGPRDGIRRISVNVKGSLPRSSLGGFMGALESEAPFIIIDSFKAGVISGGAVELTIGGSSYLLAEGGS